MNLEDVRLVFIYLDDASHIVNIEQTKHRFSGDGGAAAATAAAPVIDKNQLLYYIESRRTNVAENKKYRLIHLLGNCIESPDIDNLADIDTHQIRVHSIFNDIVFAPCHLAFHSLQTMYFVFSPMEPRDNSYRVAKNKITCKIKRSVNARFRGTKKSLT